MPPDGGVPESTWLWLRKARSNIALAKATKPAEAFWEDLCFDAQQAAEKALKAVLVSKWVRPPKTHDIAQLIALLGDHGVEAPADIAEAAKLSRYAVDTRYPGPPEATQEQHREAIALAERVVRWAEGQVGKKKR